MRIITLILCLFLSAVLFAQRTVTVERTILYHANPHQTVEQAKLMAVEEAKAMAIDSVFGTNMRSQISNVMHLGNGKDRNEFFQISDATVHGRWIKDLETPRFGKIWYEDNMLNIYVTVKGRVREISSAPIQCKVKVLCDGTDDDNERDDFKVGNHIYLSFTSPVDGYLVVYLVDEEQNAFRALPYFNQSDGAYQIKGGQEYIFFSKKHATEKDKPFVEEYKITTDKDFETDLLYVVFSPNKFTKPIDKFVDEDHTQQLSWQDFMKWFGNCLNHDDDMIGEIPIMLTIRK